MGINNPSINLFNFNYPVVKLNKDIEKFGIVIEKVEKLPDTYQDVKEQFEIVKKIYGYVTAEVDNE